MLSLAREPLTQFLLIGVVIFGLEQWVLDNTETPRRIVVDTEQYQELVGIFQEGQGREPTPEEMQNLIIKWSQNEVMYREARLMGLDLGDEMIRQRLILKLRNVLFSNLITEIPSDEVLAAWFEQHRDAYDRPSLYDFEQFSLPEPGTVEVALALAEKMNLDPAVEPPAEARLRRYKRRPAVNVTSLFGQGRSAHLLQGPVGIWKAVPADRSWHLMRITKVYPGQPAEFADVRSQVVVDWEDDARKRELTAALGSIVERYEIQVDIKTAVNGKPGSGFTPQSTSVQNEPVGSLTAL